MNKWAFGAILVAFIALCCAFNSLTPYRKGGNLVYQRGQRAVDIGAPDERQHANYIAHLKSGAGFPVLDPKDPNLGENYQSHQPPLYYLIAAGWSSLTVQDPTAESSGFPMRFLNTVIGCGGLVGVYWLARWAGFGENVALASMAVALLPMNLALHAAISNDPLLYCLCTWCLALVIKALNSETPNATVYLCGLLFGLAVLTKTTGMACTAILVAGAFVAWKEKQRGWYHYLGAVGLGLFVASPWLVRNQTLYGDPFAMKQFLAAFTGNPKASDFIQQEGVVSYFSSWVTWWTGRSFIGAFGYMDIYLFEKSGAKFSALFYNLAWFALIVTSLGQVLAPRLGRAFVFEKAPSPNRFWIPAGALAVVVVLLFVQFNLRYFQGQARYLYPAISVFAVTVGSGAVAWLKDKGQFAWIVVAAALIAIDCVALSQLPEAFAMRLGQSLGP